MKLHQLRYLAAVAQTGLNITAAAEKLHTSQPGVSQADQAARGRARFPDLRPRRPQPLARHACGPAGDRPRGAHPARGAEHQAALGRIQGRGSRHALDRHDPHPGALRAAGCHQAVSRELPGRAAAPAPGHLGTARRDGRTRPHRLRDRHRLAVAVRGLHAAALLSLAPARGRTEGAPAREAASPRP